MLRIEVLKKEIKELEEKTTALKQELKLERQKKEIDYPFNYKENCYLLSNNGVIVEDWWSNSGNDQRCYRQGNFFKTKKEALREHYRRELLTRFRQFRDKCNGDWKPKWINNQERKYFMGYLAESEIYVVDYCVQKNVLNLFGYFKNADDCERAIELFGDEIKRLFLEEE